MSPAAVFPVLSFLLAGLLAVFLILTLLWRRVPSTGSTNTVYTNTSYRTAIIALALWLLLGNAVHAVNTLVWASTDAVRVPVWCDIVTKLLLGTTMALPGACISLALALRSSLSSQRKTYDYSRLVDVALCYVLPLLYMVLHFAVQEHRFDLTLSLGCSASIHRSTGAMLVMILPPLGLCGAALVVCLFSIYTAARARHPPAPRSPSTSTPSLNGLRLADTTHTLLLTTAVLLATLLPLFGPHTGAGFNRDFSSILLIRVPAEVSAARTAWWALPGVSIAFLLLAPFFLLGADTTAAARNWLRGRLPTPRKQNRPELRRLTLSFQHEMLSKSSLLMTPAPTVPSPVQLQLRSGWDGMLDDVKTRTPAASSRRPGLGVGLGFLINPNASRKSVISAAYSDYGGDAEKGGRASSDEEEEAFTSSTLSYLASPVAQALGLESPVGSATFAALLPNPAPRTSPSSSPIQPDHGAPPTPIAIPPAPTPPPPLRPALRLTVPHPRAHTDGHSPHPPKQPIPDDAASTISESSLWVGGWPLPPVSPVTRPPTRTLASSPTLGRAASGSVRRSPTVSSRGLSPTSTRTLTSAASPTLSRASTRSPTVSLSPTRSPTPSRTRAPTASPTNTASSSSQSSSPTRTLSQSSRSRSTTPTAPRPRPHPHPTYAPPAAPMVVPV